MKTKSRDSDAFCFVDIRMKPLKSHLEVTSSGFFHKMVLGELHVPVQLDFECDLQEYSIHPATKRCLTMRSRLVYQY